MTSVALLISGGQTLILRAKADNLRLGVYR
jgi:hypothetical protein